MKLVYSLLIFYLIVIYSKLNTNGIFLSTTSTYNKIDSNLAVDK